MLATRVFAILFCFYLSSVTVYGQSKVDSLLQVRQRAQHDTTRVNTDLLIAEQLRRSSLDSSLFYFDRALAITRNQLKELPQYEGRVLYAKAEAYRLNGREDCFDFFRQAMSVFEKVGLDEELALSQFGLAKSLDNFSHFDDAIGHYKTIISRNIDNGTDFKMAASYNNAGLLYFYLRRLDKASAILLDGIKYVKSTPDTLALRALYMNYGLVIEKQNRFELAKEYMKKALIINEVIGNRITVARDYTNIGTVLIKQDSLDEAVFYLTKGWKIAKEVTSSTWPTANYYNHLSMIEYLRGNYQLAHDHVLKSVVNLHEGMAPQSKGDIYGSLVEKKIILADSVYGHDPTKQKQLWQEALPYAIEGWKLAERSEAGNVRYRLALAKANLYSKLEEFEKAFKFSRLAMEISQDINDQAKTEAIARMSEEFETERIEAQNELLRETRRTQTAQLKQQNLVIYGAIALLVLILVIAVIIYRSRLKLKSANQTIEKSLSEKELLLKEIHHRVKNNLQVVSSLLDLQSRGIEDEEALSTFMEGQNRVKAMALIHQKLYQNENLATIDFAEYAENLMKELATIYPSAKGVKTNIQANGNSAFDIDTAVPLGLILNELISNAYKYAFGQGQTGELNVSVESLGEGKHQLTVSDTGEGLPNGFDLMRAKSLGLRLVRRLAKQLYGSVEYIEESGAKFVVSFSETQLRKAL